MGSYSLGTYFEDFIKQQITTGRFNNASEILREGLRLVEERENKLQALRKEIREAIEQGGSHTPEEVLSYIENRLHEQ